MRRNRQRKFEIPRGALKNADLSSLLWLPDYYDDEQKVLGGDPFLYGIEKSRATIEAELRHVVEQGLLTKAPAIEELFADVVC